MGSRLFRQDHTVSQLSQFPRETRLAAPPALSVVEHHQRIRSDYAPECFPAVAAQEEPDDRFDRAFARERDETLAVPLLPDGWPVEREMPGHDDRRDKRHPAVELPGEFAGGMQGRGCPFAISENNRDIQARAGSAGLPDRSAFRGDWYRLAPPASG
jgi:hypothetical protein